MLEQKLRDINKNLSDKESAFEHKNMTAENQIKQ